MDHELSAKFCAMRREVAESSLFSRSRVRENSPFGQKAEEESVGRSKLSSNSLFLCRDGVLKRHRIMTLNTPVNKTEPEVRERMLVDNYV